MHSLLRVLGMLVPALLATTFSVTYLLQRHIVRLASRYLPRVLFFVRVANRDSPKLVALTIDDGIDADITPSVLRLLKRYGAGATFFIIGDHVTQAGDVGPKLLSEAVAVGCELGNHTWFDRATWKLSTATLRKELREVDDLITHAHLDAQLPVPRLKWFRPGHGFFNKRMLQAAEEAGYRTALGDVFPYDHAVGVRREHLEHGAGAPSPGQHVPTLGDPVPKQPQHG